MHRLHQHIVNWNIRCLVSSCIYFGCVQRTGKVADRDLGRFSKRPAWRFNVIHCSPVPPGEDDESRGSAGSKHSTNSNKEEGVMQYVVSSNPFNLNDFYVLTAWLIRWVQLNSDDCRGTSIIRFLLIWVLHNVSRQDSDRHHSSKVKTTLFPKVAHSGPLADMDMHSMGPLKSDMDSKTVIPGTLAAK